MTRLSIPDSVAALQRGAVLLMDTDTLPGLHALATVPDAAARLAELKGHAPDRPYLLLVETVEAAFRLGRPASAEQERRLRELWPGALTALLIPTGHCPEAWTAEGKSVGVRVPGSGELRALLARLGEPLLSTSANKAGEAPATDLGAAATRFPGLDLVPLRTNGGMAASTIVDCTVIPTNLIRAGSLTFGTESEGGRLA